jgi:large subunit ribosomal protein L3
MLGLIGKKVGMTQVFNEDGTITPVTVIEVEKNVVLGQREKSKNGYDAVITGAVKTKEKRLTKTVLGQFKDKIEPRKLIREFRDPDNALKDLNIGDEFGVELFEGISFVDVKGLSKGKGFQGVMKRHGFGGGRKTHGSKFHRANGSTGMAAWPSRVIRGTKMPGHMGNEKTTVQNLKIVRIDKEKQLLLVKGAVPGARKSMVLILKSKKRA